MSAASRLRYFVRDAAEEWRRSPGVNLLATATLATALTVAGLAFLAIGNLAAWIESWRRDVRVEVYLRDDAADASREAIRGGLQAEPGVARVVYVDKTEALRRFRRWFPSLAEAPGQLAANPLPASFEAYLAPDADAAEVTRRIAERWAGVPGVEDVRYDLDWVRRVDAALGVARAGGWFAAAVMFAALAVLIASVLRLAVHARRDEIEVMLLVGATPGLVRGPFVVAGLAQGLLAGVLALATVEMLRQAALRWAAARGMGVAEAVLGAPLGWQTSLAVVGFGVAVAFAASWLAVRQDLGARRRESRA